MEVHAGVEIKQNCTTNRINMTSLCVATIRYWEFAMRPYCFKIYLINQNVMKKKADSLFGNALDIFRVADMEFIVVFVVKKKCRKHVR